MMTLSCVGSPDATPCAKTPCMAAAAGWGRTAAERRRTIASDDMDARGRG